MTLTILRFIPNLIIRCTIYEVKFIICVLSTFVYVTFKCHPTSARPRNFRRIPQNCTEIFSAEFCGIPEKNWNDSSVHFHWISAHFNITVKFYGNVRKSEGKASLYGNVRNCTEIGETKLCGNVRKSDLIEIWVELAFQLDLNCSENAKITIVKSC